MRGYGRPLLGILLAGAGALLLFAGLTRLGWRRHGTSIGDLGFLHLDWVLQPHLPYWPGHRVNLGATAFGLFLAIAGMTLVLRRP